ncbi:MAG: type II toxin-antitoxin system RelE/ParE family toxin [Archaeoglobaceae archaeon]|nr:type II toxin-antitoxin system RelE/ParE family toxin [Archaeoglobaceae archaeon]
MFEVIIHKEVVKDAKKRLPASYRRKLARFTDVLKDNPVPSKEFDIKAIKGEKRKNVRRFRLRLGSYRIFYDVYWKEKIVVVLKIEPRERAY